MAESHDAIIIGGGHNGLVAASYLARAGLSVLVLERRHIVGGPCAALEYFPGYRAAVSNSPGSLEPKIVLDMELERFGLRFDRPDPSLLMPYPDGRCFVGWREKSKVVEELRKFSEKDATAYYEIFDFLTWFAKRLKVSLFEPPPSLRELVAGVETPEDEEAFGKIMFGSIRDFLDERLESDEVKAILAILSVLHNMVDTRTPGTPYMLLQRPLSLASMSVNAEYDPRLQPLRGSTGLPKGGMGGIAKAMEASLKSVGVKIRTEAEVVGILADETGVKGVALASGEEIRAGIVLSNLHPKTTYLDLVPAGLLDPEVVRKAKNHRARGSAFKMGLALDGLPRFRAARDEDQVGLYAACQFRIAPSMDYIDRAYDDAKYGRWSQGPMLWGLTPSVCDPTLAPPGKHVMSVNIFHAPYDLREGDWETERERFGRRCIDVLAEYIPNLKDIIVDYRFWSPRDLEDEFGLLGANISHGDMVPGMMFSFRPFPGWSRYRTPIKGLYLCGSGTWPGGLVSGLPGHNASHQVLKDIQRAVVGAGARRKRKAKVYGLPPPPPDVSNRL
ncbi:MAG: phytoene desaturase family protein [Pseudomonadota bacterium]